MRCFFGVKSPNVSKLLANFEAQDVIIIPIMATLKLGLDTRRGKNAHVDHPSRYNLFWKFYFTLNVGVEITRKSSPHFL